jgi:hypothetical protein
MKTSRKADPEPTIDERRWMLRVYVVKVGKKLKRERGRRDV